MARKQPGPLVLRAESGRFLSPVDVASKIENMVETEEGTLRTIGGPCPYVPSYGGGANPTVGDAPATGTSADISPLTYGRMHGVFHARVGSRDILLCHSGDQVWEHEGWSRAWAVLIGPTSTTPGFEAELVDDTRPRFPTQFEATATGIVIVPQNGRAYFYDGEAVLPLGYDRAPAPPSGAGPGGSATTTAPNTSGYAHDRNPDDPWTGATTDTEMLFGYGRIGTVEGLPDPDFQNAGFLLNGQWNCAVQWVDRWGNLSPLSQRSNPVEIARQQSASPTGTLHALDLIRKQIAWVNISRGPEGTVGRLLCRTKDVLHSGTQKLFEVPPDSMGAEGAFATLPDNMSEFYPDNIPDGWLLVEAQEPVAVPLFRLCRMAFGRLWVANTPDDPGMVRWSMPGKWGTFLKDDVLWPDASGSQVTGLWRTALGLLVFTEASTFLVLPSDDGQSFKVATVHAQIGCVAPDSIATLPSGLTVWLGREGFYGWDGEVVSLISDPIAPLIRTVNQGRALGACAAVSKLGEYRCWLPVDGARTNTLCVVFDGASWRRRTDVEASAVCVTRDHRQYMIAVGTCTDAAGNEKNGVWLLDHETGGYETPRRIGIVETAWLAADGSEHTKSFREVRLWLREEQNRPLKIEVMRDWRDTVIETHTVTNTPTTQLPYLYHEADAPSFWNSTLLDATGATWTRRRPFWRRVSISIPSAEVIKIRISSPDVPSDASNSTTSSKWEFIGMTIEGVQNDSGSGRLPP